MGIILVVKKNKIIKVSVVVMGIILVLVVISCKHISDFSPFLAVKAQQQLTKLAMQQLLNGRQL